jgi:hypothetical protein
MDSNCNNYNAQCITVSLIFAQGRIVKSAGTAVARERLCKQRPLVDNGSEAINWPHHQTRLPRCTTNKYQVSQFRLLMQTVRL